jgi:hypothetical protein
MAMVRDWRARRAVWAQRANAQVALQGDKQTAHCIEKDRAADRQHPLD